MNGKLRWIWFSLTSLVLSAAAIAAAYACGGYGQDRSSAPPIADLRARGSEGLTEALQTYDALVEANSSAEVIDAWREAIDQIGGQRTCSVSRLYWHTDFAEAQLEAQRTGKPILSLRMLGKLTDEYSCANSRFFRTTLYSNKEISDYLREHYILHWQSVRPVPRVTIDFGDGRKLERTLTGNSAHYVLDSDGQPLDALPGLYSPQAFKAWLERLIDFHGEYYRSTVDRRATLVAAFHRGQREQVYRQWASDLERLGSDHAMLVSKRIDAAIKTARTNGTNPKLAEAANRMAVAKRAVESPLLKFANSSGPWIQTGMDDDLWQAIANLRREGVALDEASREVMRKEFPLAAEAGRMAVGKYAVEDPLVRMVRQFEDSIALDTVRNEYLLHRQIHDRFADGQPESVDALNEWVYAELFLTPSSDPWLGLAPAGVYTALDHGGLSNSRSEMASRAIE